MAVTSIAALLRSILALADLLRQLCSTLLFAVAVVQVFPRIIIQVFPHGVGGVPLLVTCRDTHAPRTTHVHTPRSHKTTLREEKVQ